MEIFTDGAERVKPAPGIPTAPNQVRFQLHENNCIVLRWSQSVVYDTLGQPNSQPLIGEG